MPVEHRMLNRVGVTYVRYWGMMRVQESRDAMFAYLKTPDFLSGQRLLIDLTAVTDWERSYADIIKLQAEQLKVFEQMSEPVLSVSLAPTQTSQTIAQLVNRSWENVPNVITRVCTTWDQAIEMLGVNGALFRDELEASM